MGELRAVLVVDDEGTVRRACERILREEGIRVVCVTRGEEAIAALPELAPDAVVLDLKMPGIGGIETLRRVRAESPGLPVVVITGYATLDTQRECMALGAAAWLPKPFGPDDLLGALRAAVKE